MKTTSYKPRLEVLYKEKLVKELQTELNLSNVMEVPKLSKIVLNNLNRIAEGRLFM